MAASLQRMLEEHSYFAACFSLWQQKEVARAYCPAVIAAIMPLPSFIAAFLTMLSRRQLVRDLHGQVRLHTHPQHRCAMRAPPLPIPVPAHAYGSIHHRRRHLRVSEASPLTAVPRVLVQSPGPGGAAQQWQAAAAPTCCVAARLPRHRITEHVLLA